MYSSADITELSWVALGFTFGTLLCQLIEWERHHTDT